MFISNPPPAPPTILRQNIRGHTKTKTRSNSRELKTTPPPELTNNKKKRRTTETSAPRVAIAELYGITDTRTYRQICHFTLKYSLLLLNIGFQYIEMHGFWKDWSRYKLPGHECAKLKCLVLTIYSHPI